MFKKFFQGVRKLTQADNEKAMEKKSQDFSGYGEKDIRRDVKSVGPINLLEMNEMDSETKKIFKQAFTTVRPAFAKETYDSDYYSQAANMVTIKVWHELLGNDKIYKADEIALDNAVYWVYLCLYNILLKKTTNGLSAAVLYKKIMDEVTKNGFHFLSLFFQEMKLYDFLLQDGVDESVIEKEVHRESYKNKNNSRNKRGGN